jgi:DNA-binding NarL/FixJ family response regulator
MGKGTLDKSREIRHAYRMASQPFDDQQEVSLVYMTIRLTPAMRQQLDGRLQHAYASGSLRLVKRIPVLLAVADGLPVSEVAHRMALGEQTVRD